MLGALKGALARLIGHRRRRSGTESLAEEPPPDVNSFADDASELPRAAVRSSVGKETAYIDRGRDQDLGHPAPHGAPILIAKCKCQKSPSIASPLRQRRINQRGGLCSSAVWQQTAPLEAQNLEASEERLGKRVVLFDIALLSPVRISHGIAHLLHICLYNFADLRVRGQGPAYGRASTPRCPGPTRTHPTRHHGWRRFHPSPTTRLQWGAIGARESRADMGIWDMADNIGLLRMSHTSWWRGGSGELAGTARWRRSDSEGGGRRRSQVSRNGGVVGVAWQRSVTQVAGIPQRGCIAKISSVTKIAQRRRIAEVACAACRRDQALPVRRDGLLVFALASSSIVSASSTSSMMVFPVVAIPVEVLTKIGTPPC
ncbi:hypothetical protein K438DRAFT_1965264 [Mycena galopus ATCC 62051]|nr:hypothetical protein K438DRAFT_1965264 [Mycena galopus ATCC 62051]